MKSLTLTLEEIKQDTSMSLAEKKAACIKIGLRPRDVEYLEFSGFFAGEKCLTFGVEIECNVRRELVESCASTRPGFAFAYESYNHTDHRSHYKFVTDGSVFGGSPIECVTPVLDDNETGFGSLKTALAVLNAAGAYVNRSCGLHVHVGVGDFTGEEIVNIYKNYQALEALIDSFMAPSRRGDSCTWAHSLQGYDYSRCTTTDTISRLMHFDRYHKVNPMAYGRHRTVEFRQHQGSVDYEKISMWVRFCCKLVAWSKKHVLQGEVRDVAEIPFLNEEEKAFFAQRIAYFASL